MASLKSHHFTIGYVEINENNIVKDHTKIKFVHKKQFIFKAFNFMPVIFI